MRILIYVPTITFDSCVGCSVHVRELSQNLLELGNEVVVIANLSNSAYDGIVAVRSTKMPGIRVLGWLVTQIQALLLLILEITKNKCQLLYTRFGFSSGPCLLMARLTGIPCVIEVNGLPRDEAKVSKVGLWGKINGYLTNWVSDTACKYAQHLVAVTPRIKEVLVAEYGIETDKIAVVPNGANTDLFKPMDTNQARRQLNLSGADYFVTFVGILAAWQGVEYLIKSAPYILEECPESKFVIVGEGPLKGELVKLAKEIGVSDWIIFTGIVPYDKVPLYINASDVCVVPKKPIVSGYSPLKMYEYMACEKPVVATRTSGFEILEGNNAGLLVNPENLQEFAEAITKLLQNPELRKQMGKNGRKYVVENHSWESVARRVAEVCRQAMKEHKAKRNNKKP